MTNKHPITPPLELVAEWTSSMFGYYKAAQWGADRELEACCEWIPELTPWDAEQLRAARRPKPPSLKEQALKVLESAPGPDYPRVMTVLNADEHALIRSALEALPE
jgi:hypothetical protein